MLIRVIRKIGQQHFKYHLLIPLLVWLLIEFVVEILRERYKWGFWTWLGPLISLLGIIVAYLIVMSFVFRKETKMGMQRIASRELEEALKDATGYFAVGAIGLREWFEVGPQVYLAAIMKRKLESPEFRYDRVLIFSRGAFKDLNSPYLSGYYAKALIEIHKAHGIRLAYLRPEETYEIMKEFEIAQAKSIGYSPPWLPNWLMQLTPGSWRGIWNRRLALGVVELGDQNHFMPFSKHGLIVKVDESKPEALETLNILLQKIKKKVYKGEEIDPLHDFSSLFG